MKSRYPTAEERRIWRESNRFTKRVREPIEDAVADEEYSPAGEIEKKTAEPIAKRGFTATPVKDAKPAPLSPLPARDASRRFKAHAEVEASLDLHGYSKEEAYEAVYRFLTRQHKAGHRHVTIITGKGRVRESILKRELPHWLNEPRLRVLLSAFAAAPPEKGGAGVTHVLLKKRRD